MQRSPAVRNRLASANPAGELVRHLDTLDWQESAGMQWAPAFDPVSGTRRLSLYAVRLAAGSSGRVFMHSSQAVLYVLAGAGRVDIGDAGFAIEPGSGCHVREGESFTIHHEGDERLELLVAVCPGGDVAPWEDLSHVAEHAPVHFDRDHPVRVVSATNAEREATGDRYFRILVGPRTGSTEVTQFIGSIPKSRAPEHFHLYEEVICVLSGEGRIWLGDENTPVRPGSLVFLPRKQPHCMECTSEDGMELLGMFYPAGSPTVNYKTENGEMK